jgi:hypothetical protein
MRKAPSMTEPKTPWLTVIITAAFCIPIAYAFGSNAGKEDARKNFRQLVMLADLPSACLGKLEKASDIIRYEQEFLSSKPDPR